MPSTQINFGRLYREHFAAAKRRPKSSLHWDDRAAALSAKAPLSRYTQEFIARMKLDDAASLLDVGCGPGTLSLPLAQRLEHVIALDFSPGMLAAVQAAAKQDGINNVETLKLAWEDDWAAVPHCDIVVASRSTMVEDMETALQKLHEKANKRVYLTHLAGGGRINQAASKAIGRPMPTLPDYIYVLNLLHQMGVHPRLDYLDTEADRREHDFRTFARHAAWALGALNEAELTRLQQWYKSKGKQAPLPLRWAFISWEK